MGEIKEPVNLDFLKREILEDPSRFISGAVDEILMREKELIGDSYEEDRIILEVLKYLFPTAEYYWTDPELIDETRKILRYKVKMNQDKESNVSDVGLRRNFFGKGKSGAGYYGDWEAKNNK